MTMEIVRYDNGDREANEIETAARLARELSFPKVASGIGRVAETPTIIPVSEDVPNEHKTLVIGTAELQPGDIRTLQAQGHDVYPIGWGIAVD
jgi:hypothetical protein